MSTWDFLPALISAGATIYGASAAQKAAKTSAKQLTDAQKGATAAELEAIEFAKKTAADNQAVASPGLISQQARITRGAALTPEQAQAVEDSRRQSLNALQGSSLRGSARATSALISDTENRVRNNFMTENQRAADSAADKLASQYFSSGTDLSNNYLRGGQAVSSGLTNMGNIAATNTAKQAELQGTAIGNIGAIVADELKKNYKTSTTPGTK